MTVSRSPLAQRGDDAMVSTMTPSDKSMTAGQIDKATANYRAMLEKHAPTFEATAVQTVLGMTELAGEMFDHFRKRVEMLMNIISRLVTVDRTRTPQQVLDATGRKQYVDRDVVDTMPCGEGVEAEVFFFKPEASEYTKAGWMSDNDLEKAFDRRGFKPADAYSLAAVNEADPAFADEHPNGTHWKNDKGQWCFAAFLRWHDGRRVLVRRRGHVWHDRWWFAGVRK